MKNKIKKSKINLSNLTIIVAINLVAGLYWRWFLPGAITLGDWSYFTKSALSDATGGLWSSGYQIIGASIQPLVAFGGFLSRVSTWDYSIIERLTSFFPILLCLIFSPWYLARTLGFNRMGIAATIVAFNLNTGIFTTVAIPIFTMAIALGLFVLATFIKLVHKPSVRHGLTLALAMAIQILYEIRIAYIFLLFCGLYFIYFWLTSTREFHSNVFKIIKILFLAVLIIILLHSFWIIPLFGAKGFESAMNSRYAGYDSSQWVRTLSYWNLLHVLGLQSIGWGKPDIINPPAPQFLFLPAIAFSVFLFFRKIKPIILFFGLTALIFSFLAKGSKPPFGEIYIWLFKYFPGFFMFREPGKWWSPVILSYAVLFGTLVNQVSQGDRLKQFFSWASKQFKLSLRIVKISLIGLIATVFFIIFPVQPISVFKKLEIFIWPVPAESGYLESFLHQQPNFFRVLWLPYPYRFGYSSSQHPAFSAVELGHGLFSSFGYRNIFSYLNQSLSTHLLRLLSVKYIIVPSVPTDFFNELYFWYSLPPNYYHNLAKNAPGVQATDFKGESKVYEIPDCVPHLYTNTKNYTILSDYELPLSTIAAMDYLKAKNPALIFPKQNSETINSLFISDNFILQDRTFADLGIEFAGSYKIPFYISNHDNKQKLKFELKKAGIYEVWIDFSKMSFDDAPDLMAVAKIDRQNLNNMAEVPLTLLKDDEHTKYVKLGELNLKAGNHTLVLNLKNIENGRPYSSLILLVEKEERIASERATVSNLRLPKKNISYIFTKDSTFWPKNQMGEGQFYNLKAKLKIKDSFANFYWQEKEQINWDKEIKSWKFGFLQNEEHLPPMVLFQNNFSVANTENIFWINNGATLLIINPLDKIMVTRLVFFAQAVEKETTLQIYVNNNLKGKISIPYRGMYSKEARRFKEIIIEDVLLVPGKNEIIFYGAGKNDIKKYKGKFNKTKNLLVQLRDNIRFEIKSLDINTRPILTSKIDFVVGPKESDIFIFSEINKNSNSLFLMSREIDIDLEEYPYFDLIYELKDKKLDIFLGIDFNNDEKVDGYLNPRILYGVNLMELARNKWANDQWHYYPSFRVKYILAISSDSDEDSDIIENRDIFLHNYFYMLRINNFRFYSNKSIVVPAGYCSLKDFKLNYYQRETYNKNIAHYFTDIPALAVFAYFHNNSKNEEEKLTDKYNSHTIEPAELSEEYVELSMPVSIVASSQNRNTYLAFSYKLQDFDQQAIDVFLGLDNDGDSNIDEKKLVPEEESIDLSIGDGLQKREINLSNFTSDIQNIKQVIFQMDKKKKNIKEGWYEFFVLDNIEIFHKYPSVIKNAELRDNLLADLNDFNFPLLSINRQEIKFSQINNKTWDIFEDKEVDLGNIKVPSGKHTVNLLENNTFKTEWIYLEASPEGNVAEPVILSPEIIFKKINQTKYIVQIKGAQNPFWLIFSETFDPRWKLYLAGSLASKGLEVVKEYKDISVKEAKYELDCSPWDFKYLFDKSLAAEHFFANFYGNAWYINPKKMNLPGEFSLVLYFWPQYLYNIGIIIAGATLIFCIGYLVFSTVKRYAKKI